MPKLALKLAPRAVKLLRAQQAKPRSVELLREPVELYKVLKFEGLVASGGEAKAAIDAGLVFVNDKVEMQKRKKLVNGDTVRMGDESLLLTLVEGYDPTAEPVKAKVEKPAPKPAPKKDWRRKRTPAQIDADAGVVSNRKPAGTGARRQRPHGASNARRVEQKAELTRCLPTGCLIGGLVISEHSIKERSSRALTTSRGRQESRSRHRPVLRAPV